MVSHIHQCRDCQESRHYYEQVWSACIYEGVIRHCIHEFKYKGNLKLIKTLVNIMIDFANIHIPVQDFDIISSVPIHPRKMHLREFNQSAILSHRLSLRFKIPLNNNLLKRTRNTLPQNQLSRRQREKNIAGAFILQDKKTLNKKILLIDDIYTTGITANECAKTLKTGGAKTVSVFTLARGY
ncbi:MAG: ComF family protein [Candidatus Omnitrophota bacterium]